MIRLESRVWRKGAAFALGALLALGTLPLSVGGTGKAAAEGVTARFSGEPSEWAAIDYDSATSAGTLQLLKAVQRDGKLYVLVEGTEVRSDGIFYVDADNDPATGASVAFWSNAGGVDYRVVGETLQRYEGGIWTDAGAAVVTRGTGIAEIAVDLSQIGLDGAGGTVKVAYGQEANNSYLPDPGKPMLNAAAESAAYGPDPVVTVDANAADWSGVEPLARSSDGLTSLYAALNNETLSILVTGKMGDWNDVYIDTDHSKATGFNTNWLWTNYGFDYLFENGTLFSNVGGGFSWNPLTVEGLQYAEAGGNDDKTIEMSVPLAGLGLSTATPLYVGFSGAERYTPEAAGEAVKVLPALPRVTVDGNDAEWAGIEPIAAGTGNAEWLSAFVKDEKLYVFAQGADLSGEKNLFIDTDNDAATGHQGWQYSRTGADYLVQNGTAYRSTGAGWSWDLAAEMAVQSATSADYAPAGREWLEMAVDLSQVSELSGMVRVALGVGDSYAPTAGSAPEYPVALSSGGAIVVDGSDADWTTVDNKAESGGATLSLNAVKDDERLILLAEGSGMNAQNEYFIDSDASAATGWADSGWTGAGVDYKISRNTLYRYDGAGGWTAAGSVYNKLDAAYDLVYAHLSDIGAATEDAIKVAYVSKNAISLPAKGGEMLSVTAAVNDTRTPGAFYPRERYDALNNPYMGWVAWALDSRKPANEPYAQPHSLVYAGISWRELEPVKGRFDWEGIEHKYQFDYWTSLGKRINLRIVLDLPTADPQQKDIPDWLYDELVAAETESGAGKWYATEAIGSGFAPNYSSPVLIAEHDRMIKALAQRYDNDSRIAFIQIGSLGHWGEFHNWPEDVSGAFPKVGVSDQYVQDYIENFTHKPLGIRKPFPIAASNGFGLFNDVLGDKGSTQSWLSWIENGWSDIGLYLDEGQDAAQAQAASRMPDFWKDNYSGGEFTSGNPLLSLNDDVFLSTLEQVRHSHTSWLGPSSPADYVVGSGGVTQEIQENMNTLLTTMGYRFVLESASHAGTIAAGEKLQLNTQWLNRGIAPIYHDWPVAVALADENGNLIQPSVTKATDTDIRSWLPGAHAAPLSLNVPESLRKGTYSVLIGILDPDTNKPGIQLAIEGGREDGWYALDTVEVTGKGGNGNGHGNGNGNGHGNGNGNGNGNGHGNGNGNGHGHGHDKDRPRR